MPVSELARSAQDFYAANRLAEAVEAIAAAIRLDPASAQLHNALGVYLTAAGDFAGAERALREALRLDPGLVAAYHNLLELRHVDVPPELLQRMLGLAERGGLGAADAALLDYSISLCYRRQQDRVAEFRYLDRAKLAMARLQAWDVAGFSADVATVMNMGQGEYARLPVAPRMTPGPIIICSMPRSGSTLLDRILASHPDVTSLGEAGLATRATQATVAHYGLPQPLYPCWLSLAASAEVFAGAYRAFGELVAAYRVETLHFSEKSVNNDILLGLWLLAYPQARVLHLRRHPLDICLSCYQSHFAHGVAFSNKLAWVAERYRLHERLMEHWKRLFPGRVMTVAYEDVVRTPRAAIGGVLRFLGLPWDDACLAFQDSGAPERSASNWQVRQPLYQTSIGRWQQYRAQLADVMDLAGEGTVGN